MNLKQCKVLLVDDIKANINILVKALRHDYDVDYVCDGESVFKYVGSTPPDLILLDILMPDMDGYEVLRRLKADDWTKDIPVVFITSKSETEDESKGLELGAVDYIIKPFSIPIVRARVKNHLIMKKQRDMLENLSHFDGLTGIPNRRSFDRIMDNELRRAIRSSTCLSLLLIDIDFFKQFNDHYGHTTGDDCLRLVANILANSVGRSSDFVARYGGEEFAVVLSETDSQGAETIAEAMRKNIEILNVRHSYSSIADRITVSIGIATMVPTRDTSAYRLIQRADRALYEAKNRGRNRVEIFNGKR